MSSKLFMSSLIVCLYFLTSCSSGEVVNPNLSQKKTIEPSLVPTLLITATGEIALPTSTSTLPPKPTTTSTKTEIVPALNGTPSPALEKPIEKSNVEKVQVLRRTGSQNGIVVIGKSGERWFIEADNNIKYFDTKTNEMVWQTDLSPNLNLFDNEGNTVFKVFNESFQVVRESGESKDLPFPVVEGRENGSVQIAVNFQKEMIAIGVNTPFYYVGPPIPVKVYKWGETTPQYSFFGNNFGFSTNGDYLTYLLGMNLQVVNSESGKLLTEFGLNNENSRWMTSWDDKYIAFSRKSKVEIWRLEDRKLVRTLQEEAENDWEAFDFKFSEDSQTIMVLQPGKTIRSWSITSGVLIEKEETGENELTRIGVSNEGKILHYELPQLPGRTWKSEFNSYSNLRFSKTGDILTFANEGLDRFGGFNEICQWNLIDMPTCETQKRNKWTLPAEYKVLGYGTDDIQYHIKPFVKPLSINKGWGKDEKLVTRLPELSSSLGTIRQFIFDDPSRLVFLQLSQYESVPWNPTIEDTFSNAGKNVFIFNRQTNRRILTSGRMNRFIISPDSKFLYELRNEDEKQALLVLIQYDSQTLKEVSKTSLDLRSQKLAVGVNLEALIPVTTAVKISPDGNNLYAIVSLKTAEGSSMGSGFLTIPLENPTDKNWKWSNLNLKLAGTTNLVMSPKGDLAVFAAMDSGSLLFLETETGKIDHIIPVGGKPAMIEINPGGDLIVIADQTGGIQVIGIPAE